MRRRNYSNNNPREDKNTTPKSMDKNVKSKKKSNRSRKAYSDRAEDTTKSGNDPAWYAADPNILRDAASYPFSYCTGASEVHDYTFWGDSSVMEKPWQQVPGLASLHVVPGIGTALAATDPVNVAAQSVYSFVRHANSGHSNYDASDLMMYILAMANMYSFLVWCERLYGYALTYEQRNRYLPSDLIRTNNVDTQDLINNLANFRFWVNTLIAKMTSFAVPATMSIFSRMSFMYSSYYVEGTSIKEQLYQFVPEGFYEFGIDSSSLGELTWKPFDYTTLMSVADVINYGDSLFNAIWSQEDFGIMSGDILKAYGDNIIKIPALPEYYNLTPSFDAMVLTQMKNADLVRVDVARISQDPNNGTILQTLVPVGFSTSDVFYGTTTTMGATYVTVFNKAMVSALKDFRILTVDTDDPTPDVVIEATRLKVAYDGVKSWYKIGTELITKVVLSIEPGTDIEVLPYIIALSNANNTWAPDLNKALAKLHCAARQFHYLPRFWMFNYDNPSDKVIVNDELDIDNFTVMTYEDVKKLHEAATINMFAVPSIGKIL